MAQASAADRGDEPSSNSAIASIRREARASWVRAAAARKSASVRSKRVIATVIAIPLLSQERRITPYRVAPIHLRVSGPGDWYHPVDLVDGDLGFAAERLVICRYPRPCHAIGIAGPALRQEQPQAHHHRHLAARQCQRDQRLAIRSLAEHRGVLRGHANGMVALRSCR